ncbi:adenosine monophosphate-protein transferase SoFic [archaeon BMS3Bbin16]|nr:adenosine monophosphate-protein transferase SoFic [archaeon BMS3Bbin16]
MADTDMIRKELLQRIESKKEKLNTMRPLPRDALKRLQEEMRLMHTYHSNAIEGNTLTLSETKLVIEEGITIGGKPLKDYLEAQNTARAYEMIEGLTGRKKITHETVQKTHEALTKGILDDAGRYRTKNVRITGAVKTPPSFSKVVKLMGQLLDKVNKDKKHPIETSAFLHHNFVEIHPFTDGNGRTARLLNNLYLMRHGYPPIILRKEDRAKYYKFLRSADTGNLTPFANFIAKAVDEALIHYLSIFGGEDELMPLKELAKASPYSQEYLSLRARQGRLAAVKIGNIWHASKRALREYRT